MAMLKLIRWVEVTSAPRDLVVREEDFAAS